jgi:hypothetical protein
MIAPAAKAAKRRSAVKKWRALGCGETKVGGRLDRDDGGGARIDCGFLKRDRSPEGCPGKNDRAGLDGVQHATEIMLFVETIGNISRVG